MAGSFKLKLSDDAVFGRKPEPAKPQRSWHILEIMFCVAWITAPAAIILGCEALKNLTGWSCF